MVSLSLVKIIAKGWKLGFFEISFQRGGEDVTLKKENELTTSFIQIKEGKVSFNINIKSSVSNQKELDKIQIDYNNVKRDAKILAELIANK